MGKRKKVPAALYTELSEYSSLIRALRTVDTLDLTSQLTRAQPAASPSQDTHESDESESEENDEAPSNPSTSRGASSNAVSDKAKRSKAGDSGKAKAKDNWTRWPLLTRDLHTLQFDFRDEIKTLALQVLRSQQLEQHSDGDEAPLDEDDEDTILPPTLLDSLTLASSTHLSQVLSALAAHIPLTEKSMQNRINPIGWEGVLDIVAVSGLVDPKSVF
jgi:hypothetical protein